jgi:hypothetical protein
MPLINIFVLTYLKISTQSKSSSRFCLFEQVVGTQVFVVVTKTVNSSLVS